LTLDGKATLTLSTAVCHLHNKQGDNSCMLQ
jgi:hypothetical protein